MTEGLAFIFFAIFWAAVCCAIGYSIDKLRGHCAMIDRIVKRIAP